MTSTFIPRLLFADAGLPMIFLTFPAMGALLLPIILIEAWLCRRWLGLSPWTSIKANAVANFLSTLIGVPVAWGAMLGVEFFVFSALTDIPVVKRFANADSPIARIVGTMLSSAWLGPDEKNLYWMVPLAVFTLLIPTFFLSVLIERWIVDHMVGLPDETEADLASSRVRRAVRDANLVTYGMLATGATIWLLLSLGNPPR